MVIMNPRDAQSRLLTDGELAWVYGPRRQELATVNVDEDVRLGMNLGASGYLSKPISTTRLKELVTSFLREH